MVVDRWENATGAHGRPLRFVTPRAWRGSVRPLPPQWTTVSVNGQTYACSVTYSPTRQASAIEWKNT